MNYKRDSINENGHYIIKGTARHYLNNEIALVGKTNNIYFHSKEQYYIPFRSSKKNRKNVMVIALLIYSYKIR